MSSSDWLVAADDRTGALEVAAEFAAVTGAPVPVVVHPEVRVAGVVDLVSRRCDAADAASRATHAARAAGAWYAHKIDSTLRGNWVDELRAVSGTTGRRVLLMAAWPDMGRTCVDGVVHVHGRPVGDLRHHVDDVEVLHGTAALQAWLYGTSSRWGVCEVPDTEALHGLASIVAPHDDVVVAGPAGALGAVFAARAGVTPQHRRLAVTLPALVVCGSATSEAAAQVAELRRRRPDVDVIAAPPHDGGDLDPRIAHALTEEGRRRSADGTYGTLVVVGGDTASAFLGDEPRLVGGAVLPGLPWSLDLRGRGAVVVTKAGAFGGPDTLVRLFDEEAMG